MNEEELKDGELLATADPITTEELDAAVLPTDPNQVLPSNTCLLYTSPSPRDLSTSRMPSSA